MDDWVDRAARALDQEPLEPSEIAMVLRLARDVARGVERKTAPLAAYLAGVVAGKTAASGGDPDRPGALRDAIGVLGPLIPATDDRDEDARRRDLPPAETQRTDPPAG
jgi:hypothetical protein